KLGADFITRLFGDMNVQLITDDRLSVDWLGQGKYPIGLFLSDREIRAAAAQGLPLAEIPGDQFKEGAPVGVSAGSVAMLNNAPHPNAAKAYINWLLSRDGQLVWQRGNRNPSLRL